MHSRLRIRLLLAMGLPLGSCTKHAPTNEPTDAPDARDAPPVLASSASTSTAAPTPSDAAGASSSMVDAVVDAAPTIKLKKPPTTWSVTYSSPHAFSACTEVTAQCFPRAHVPYKWGNIVGPLVGDIGSGQPQMGCAAMINVPCGCTPGAESSRVRSTPSPTMKSVTPSSHGAPSRGPSVSEAMKPRSLSTKRRSKQWDAANPDFAK
jgi:hypothetical protein